MAIDIIFTFKILIIAVIGFWVITAWDTLLDNAFLKVIDMDNDEILPWLIIGIIATFIFIIVLMVFDIEAHDILGIAETVDLQLTGHPEVIENGKLVRY